MAADLIDDFLSRLSQHLPQTQGQQARLEADLRQHWGGSNGSYIRKTIGTARKTKAIGHALQSGQPLDQAIAAVQVSRRTAYRYLARPWPIKP
jgi:hypothetical protein